ncbi:MAG TPA: winged helix-turn-helix domain-containing protein [Candidatus Acidoferrum sp.]|jgi:DNA-binding winged helix-turn-helix (wHTH) protein|nr:winged helix-turn-helix domain-containing protein [Candidatus Acidoferrum sp.]
MSTQMVSIPTGQRPERSNASSLVPARYLRFGVFQLDLQREELFKDGVRVKLQGKVYQALLALLEKPGDVVTREELRMRLWPADTHVNYDANVNTTVNKLRQVLGDSADQPGFVDTIPRKGYSFVAKVERLDQLAPRNARRDRENTPVETEMNSAERKTSFLGMDFSSKWFAGSVAALIVAGMLFGAALMLYASR